MRNGPFSLRVARRAALAALAGACLAVAAPSPTPAASSAALEDTRWLLVAVGTEPAGAEPAYLVLRPQGGKKRMGGESGCGRFSGTYDRFAGRLRFFPENTPAANCSETALRRRKALLEALRETANFQIEGDALTLQGADGRALARFAARRAPA